MPKLRELPPETQAFYSEALSTLKEARIPFLVGGAFALEHYTGIVRWTKDLDIFVRQFDVPAVLECLSGIGCRTEVTFPHWLAKATRGEDVVDIIFSSGNGVGRVDDEWFRHATPGATLGTAVRFCPAEEMIWHKAFVMERERFDGADVAHLLRARASSLDWPRLLARFGRHWRVLLAHLVLFGFVYPFEAERVPVEVMDELIASLEAQLRARGSRSPVCRGTLLSRAQYLVDVDEWGLRDVRLGPETSMTADDVRRWTDGIAVDGPE
jgi:hypothetical protein